jgi:hypothetical protein
MIDVSLDYCRKKTRPFSKMRRDLELAWKRAKEYTPTLDELKSMEMPEIDLENIWSNTTDSTKALSEKLKSV